MVENPPITVLAEPIEINSHGNHATVIGLGLDIFGQPVHFRIAAAQRHARLADIVPIARILSTKLAWAILDKLHKQKNFVPCRKGCSACCNYLIPLSVPEVFRMREEILAMPAKQSKAVLTSCLDAAKGILDDNPESLHLHATANSVTQTTQLGRWYADLKLACPFLSSGLCTIYEQRPTACREHFVTGSALLCETKWMDQSQLVRMPVSILDALGQLAGELEGTSVQAVMLPLALPWAQENLERDQRTWPAAMMAERFVEILKTMASKNLAVTVASA